MEQATSTGNRTDSGKVGVASSSIAGLGVFARSELAAGEVVLSIDDSCVVDAAHPVPEGEESHLDYLSAGKTVLMQVPERYINHSCDPNVFVRTRDGVREVVALRAIRAQQEITYDYSINGFGDTVWICTCQSSRCRHSIHSDFFHLPIALQREYLPLLDAWFRAERPEQIQALTLGSNV